MTASRLLRRTALALRIAAMPLGLAGSLLVGGALLPRLAPDLLRAVALAEDGEGGDHDGDNGGSNSGSSGGDSGGDDSGGDDSGGDDSGGDDSGGDDSGGDDDSADDGSESESAGDPGSLEHGRDIVPDEIVVINEDAAFLGAAGGLGFRVIAQQPLGSLGITVTRLRVPAHLDPVDARTLLRERFPHVLVDRNNLYRTEAALSLPAIDYPARLIGWNEAAVRCGRGASLGLVDTGMDAANPAFAGRDIERRAFLAAGEAPAPTDHGTAVAAILVGTGGRGLPPGLLPEAHLRLAEAFTLGVDGQPAASVVGIAAALDWLVQTHTPVVNLSFAGADNLVLAIAVKRASQRGAVLVAAAGNDGPGGAPSFPAAYPEVVAVAALDQDLNPYAGGTQGDFIDFAAPGVGIATAGPDGLTLVSGSSFAAPFVAAAAAARTAGTPPGDVEAIRAALAQGARDLGKPGRDSVFGWGLVQAPACAAS